MARFKRKPLNRKEQNLKIISLVISASLLFFYFDISTLEFIYPFSIPFYGTIFYVITGGLMIALLAYIIIYIYNFSGWLYKKYMRRSHEQ